MRKYLFLCGCAVASPAMAQQEADDERIIIASQLRDELITVVATGIEGREETGQAVTVIGEAEIDAIQGPDITRVLRRAPGVTTTRNGGLGGFTGVRVRGAGAEQLLVLVDGVRVNDPSSPGGGFDFSGISGANVEKVELLRGANSVVWGSDALGGVMNLSTRDLSGFRASAEYGGDDQLSASAAYGAALGPASFSLYGDAIDRAGFSAAASGTETDGYERVSLGGNGRLGVGRGLNVVAHARYARGALEIDGFPAPAFTFADTLERQDSREFSGRVGAEYARSGLALRGGVAKTDIARDLVDEAVGTDPYLETRGGTVRAELFGQAELSPTYRLNFGADHEWSDFSSFDGFSATDADARIASGHALLTYDDGTLLASGGARIDSHDAFGEELTFGANAAYRLGGQWQVRASFGEGFKVPTLFQLYSDFGNATLSPERSTGYDIGVDYGARWRGGLFASLTAFRRDSNDLIDFVSCFGVTDPICTDRPFGTYDNVGRTRAEGIELELGAALDHGFTARAAYGYLDARDRETGRALSRRPDHAITVSLDWASDFGLSLGGGVRLVSDSFDSNFAALPLDGYALADVRAALPIGDALELFGRIENVTDADYVEVAGYNTQGRAAYAGVRVRM